MADCSICGEKIPEGSRTCSVCGSSVDEFLPTATELKPAKASVVSIPKDLPPGGSYCPACAKVYWADYTDQFCVCGTQLLKEAQVQTPGLAAEGSADEDAPDAELVEEPPAAAIIEEAPMAPVLEEAPPLAPIVEEVPAAALVEDAPPMAPIVEEAAPADEEETEPAVKVRAVKPPSGTPCLVLYGPDKKPLQYFSLTKDATTIGRLDAVKGVFPDIDLDEWFDRSVIRRISRQHALILRTRATGAFALRPLAGNTGTQLEADMLTPLQDYPLRPGHRIVLGGVIRLKFEIA